MVIIMVENDVTKHMEVSEQAESWKNKKFVRRRKSKKDKEDPLVREIRLTVESGKVEFGYKKGVRNALLAKAKMFIVAKNAPEEVKADIFKYSKLSQIPVIEFSGSSVELGSICGKPFPVSVLSIYDEGNSNILDMDRD